jgi:arsenate reductase
MIKIYHNTKCSTSRKAMDILKDQGVKFETIEYLKTPPTEKEIKALLKMLGTNAEDIVRKKESLFKEKFAGKKLTEEQWIKILSENPVLIERPIIVKGNKAVIGRPLENILELLK